MFGFMKKRQVKDFEFKVKVIEDVGTLKTQNEFMWNHIKELESRIEYLEQKVQVGF